MSFHFEFMIQNIYQPEVHIFYSRRTRYDIEKKRVNFTAVRRNKMNLKIPEILSDKLTKNFMRR
jgi:hypothetical protein